MIKILISTRVNGLSHITHGNRDMFDTYFDIFGMKYHRDIGFFVDYYLDEPDYYYTIKVVDGNMYDWDLESIEFRTDPLIHQFFHDNGLLDNQTKVIEIPDDVQWAIASWEDGSESIEENHRSWS